MEDIFKGILNDTDHVLRQWKASTFKLLTNIPAFLVLKINKMIAMYTTIEFSSQGHLWYAVLEGSISFGRKC